MKYLKGKMTYLCGAMGALDDSGMGWRDMITPRLQSYGITVADPARKTTDGISEIGEDKAKFKEIIKREDWKAAKEAFWPVARWDLRSVDKSDFLILNYDALVPSVGTWDEMVVANMQKKPILFKYDRSQLDDFNIWTIVRIKPQHFFAEWDDMFEYLDGVDNGQLDTSYWTL
jgi:hypothetical protein